MTRWLEIRSYTLKPGTRDDFDRVFREQSYPMLCRWGIDVVAAGPSAHDDVSFILMRSYASLAERDASQQAFYGSDEWRLGPREAIVSRIELDTTVVLAVDEAVIAALRGAARP